MPENASLQTKGSFVCTCGGGQLPVIIFLLLRGAVGMLPTAAAPQSHHPQPEPHNKLPNSMGDGVARACCSFLLACPSVPGWLKTRHCQRRGHSSALAVEASCQLPTAARGGRHAADSRSTAESPPSAGASQQAAEFDG